MGVIRWDLMRMGRGVGGWAEDVGWADRMRMGRMSCAHVQPVGRNEAAEELGC